MADIGPRAASLAKRHLSKGGIAGVVIGACVAVLLCLLCLYPVAIRRIIRRRRQQRVDKEKNDAEAGHVPSPGGSAGTDHQRRLSSQDSFKPPADLARGERGIETCSTKDMTWTPSDGMARSDSQRQEQIPRSVPGLTDEAPRFTQPTRTNTQLTSYTGFEEEFVPESTIDTQDATLNGTSADYYNPQVPDSAFGMTQEELEPKPQPDPKRSLSRGSSLRHNLKQMFVRKSTRDQTAPNSPTSPSFIAENFDFNTRNVSLTQDGPLQPITSEMTSESPTDLDPPESERLPPADSRALGSPISLPVQQINKASNVQTPPQSPPDLKFRASASPPTNPAPGTVNPMDIMPATTETEMWHRTEHQLYMSYNQPSSPTTLPSSDQPRPDLPVDSPSPLTLPPSIPVATPTVETPTPTQEHASFKQDPADDVDIVMGDIPSHNLLTPALEQDARLPSYHSDISTPFPGPASTNASTLNTPATQLDTPSPKSDGTSDYTHSVSPSNGINSNVSPRTGGFPCNEPGCGQVFDQPHKLKHHQRYHTKEHKCHYPGCGKGFGTKTHLQRHINDRHEKKKKFHCAVPGCDYSRQGGKGFPRKDNWKRHMTKIHNMDQRYLPEPVEVDSDMTGV
ncbi:hypothetical protein BGZ63DRAFT_146926 [Mariannaea sp. PMI_226]|nr:hypothetical protein BGZ63DRAFT_146926 [Mariannaea sp. PMI_226]